MEGYKSCFAKQGIRLVGLLAAHRVTVRLPRLLEKTPDFHPRCVMPFAVPYFVSWGENLSAYATSRDYHGLMKQMGALLCEELALCYPSYRFLSFADHSPIDERQAAAAGGLGILGSNGLLITKEHSSFVFLGAVLSDAPVEELGKETYRAPESCLNCGKCRNACPTGILRGENAPCLSALTQKKGELSLSEQALLRRGASAWGCDACQRVCPHTEQALRKGTLQTSLPYFHRDRILNLTREGILAMTPEEFAERAFAWRGRGTVLRNLALLEDPPTEAHPQEPS